MRAPRALVCVLLLCASMASARDAVSFLDVRTRVFTDAFSDVPSYPLDATPELWIIRSFFAGTLFGRFRDTLNIDGDFKEEGLKPVHRAGICADGTWRITTETAATGLLAKGTEVPAILRFAAGTNRTVGMAMAPRTFGIAIKLFPSRNQQEPVIPRDMFVFDQTGLDGDTRPHFLPTTGTGEPLRFSNVVRATTPIAKFTNFMLGRFDGKPHLRELYLVTGVDGDGRPVRNPVTPYEIALTPVSPDPGGDVPDDYRRELARYAPGSLVFNIELPAEPGVRGPIQLGTLTVGQMVMSKVCDETLHFPHPRSR